MCILDIYCNTLYTIAVVTLFSEMFNSAKRVYVVDSSICILPQGRIFVTLALIYIGLVTITSGRVQRYQLLEDTKRNAFTVELALAIASF